MTRKDYVQVERILQTVYKDATAPHLARSVHYRDGMRDAIERVAIILCDELESNPRFDRDHFLAVVRGERELNSKPSHIAHCPSCGNMVRGETNEKCEYCGGTARVR